MQLSDADRRGNFILNRPAKRILAAQNINWKRKSFYDLHEILVVYWIRFQYFANSCTWFGGVVNSHFYLQFYHPKIMQIS